MEFNFRCENNSTYRIPHISLLTEWCMLDLVRQFQQVSVHNYYIHVAEIRIQSLSNSCLDRSQKSCQKTNSNVLKFTGNMTGKSSVWNAYFDQPYCAKYSRNKKISLCNHMMEWDTNNITLNRLGHWRCYTTNTLYKLKGSRNSNSPCQKHDSPISHLYASWIHWAQAFRVGTIAS